MFCSFWLVPFFFFLFSVVVLFYLVVVVSIVALFFLIYILIFLILFYFLFSVIVLLLFFLFFCQATWLVGPWFPGWGLSLSFCDGSDESNPLVLSKREPQIPGNINQSEASWRSSSQHQDSALPNGLQTPVLDTSGETTSKTGTQSDTSKKKK